MTQERRKFLRLNINVNFKWKKLPGGKKEVFEEGSTKNISGGGVCLMSYKKISKGDILVIEMQLPTGKTINSKAKVVWVSEIDTHGASGEKRYDAGVEFLDITESDREDIKEFCLAPPGDK